MAPMKREDGTRSRTMDTIAVLAVLTAFETSMLAFREYIPDQWQWAYPVIHTGVLMWMAFLRATTTQGLGK